VRIQPGFAGAREEVMQALTASAEQTVQQLSQRYGVSMDAVKTLLSAVAAGGGSMAQFYHPELGGGGQWMRGGMTMVGDMFNSGLQATVSGLCAELSSLLGSTQVFAPAPQPASGGGGLWSGNNWWPAELGSPSSSGGQNDARYAYFPGPRRLALQRQGQVTIYDTLDHQIGGVQQQQGGYPGSLSFSSQYGTFTVDSLPQVSPAPVPNQAANNNPPWASTPPAAAAAPNPAPVIGSDPQSSSQIIDALERLGKLVQAGVLTDEEFRSKKAELLARL
jgi:hypothetical protein